MGSEPTALGSQRFGKETLYIELVAELVYKTLILLIEANARYWHPVSLPRAPGSVARQAVGRHRSLGGRFPRLRQGDARNIWNNSGFPSGKLATPSTAVYIAKRMIGCLLAS